MQGSRAADEELAGFYNVLRRDCSEIVTRSTQKGGIIRQLKHGTRCYGNRAIANKIAESGERTADIQRAGECINAGDERLRALCVSGRAGGRAHRVEVDVARGDRTRQHAIVVPEIIGKMLAGSERWPGKFQRSEQRVECTDIVGAEREVDGAGADTIRRDAGECAVIGQQQCARRNSQGELQRFLSP